MEMSTQTWDDAGALLGQAVLVDTLQILDVGEPVTIGTKVVRSLTPVGEPVAGLVQTTSLANAAESLTVNIYSVKVARKTVIFAGQAIRLLACRQEPDLVGKVLLLDKVSQNGLAVIRKAVASDTTVVNQEGKEVLV
ncbi:hypothetical protein SEA_MANDALORIAN_9 [Microbacterium phage Mandalorian]|nr:hypothetical protein SEA_MANDALORIAN_9 [Microbacterium phage Mandalorian]